MQSGNVSEEPPKKVGGKQQYRPAEIKREEPTERLYPDKQRILKAIDGLYAAYPDEAVNEALRRVGISEKEVSREENIIEIEDYLKRVKSNVNEEVWQDVSESIKRKYPNVMLEISPQLVQKSNGVIAANMSEVVWFQINAENTFKKQGEETVYTIKSKGAIEIGTKTINTKSQQRTSLDVNNQSLIVPVSEGDQALQTTQSLTILKQLPRRQQEA